ncbi:hypothetical protein COT95_02785 [Candidatus Falkowbacteria bacterium CG10_big_fil_rev_8_21_14_0_10_37_6]|uniref:Glycosyltransferase 2-like domain-containing protein n=1 Tax=Candidatus Falkowbacteria bacterium CG10_big_fil_rev_8_21_14_0_10_37_6 TaxID=1974563 RepID=A0A2H0V6L6_9BACT|nr:MAG: hypothetical protein COT95_02785 [Candidatus Falkowbacteria bacterium CG10_big_fil_rev_8_21_14_0_10_37_6]
MNKSLSIIVPVHNEALNIKDTVKNIFVAIKQNNIFDYEILICESGSTDGTVQIINDLKKNNQNIKVLIFPDNYNLGEKYRNAIQKAQKKYIAYIPGDNDIDLESIIKIFSVIGKADIILTYTVNMEKRPLTRRIFSYSYTFLMNLISGYNIKYYNGACVFLASELKKIRVMSAGFSYMSEIVVKLLNKNLAYYELPMKVVGRDEDKSSALQLRNFIDTGIIIVRLFWDLKIKKIFRFEKYKP